MEEEEEAGEEDEKDEESADKEGTSKRVIWGRKKWIGWSRLSRTLTLFGMIRMSFVAITRRQTIVGNSKIYVGSTWVHMLCSGE